MTSNMGDYIAELRQQVAKSTNLHETRDLMRQIEDIERQESEHAREAQELQDALERSIADNNHYYEVLGDTLTHSVYNQSAHPATNFALIASLVDVLPAIIASIDSNLDDEKWEETFIERVKAKSLRELGPEEFEYLIEQGQLTPDNQRRARQARLRYIRNGARILEALHPQRRQEIDTVTLIQIHYDLHGMG
jgi:hypothetical protein